MNFDIDTIKVIFDGIKKNKTLIEDDVFIGCNTNFICTHKS